MPRARRHRDPAFPAVVLVDTAEQLPYTFAGIDADKEFGGGVWQVQARWANLLWGDYSIDGLEGRAAVERKSASDLFRTIGQERDRFARELAGLNEYEFAEVVVEAEWSEIMLNPPRFSKLPPWLVYRNYRAWRVRYPRVGWSFVPGREFAEKHTFRLLERVYLESLKCE
jgi:hypothetical protein